MAKSTSPHPDLQYGTRSGERYTHHLFRYPAKFHAPVARALVETYSKEGETVLDPFCGSGTLLVEAALCGRASVGSDIDPVAAFISRIKATPLDILRLTSLSEKLGERLEAFDRGGAEYERLQWADLDEVQYATEVAKLAVPAIPNLLHWFRRYAIVDLAHIKREILALNAKAGERDFFLLCFASIIRASSNADPVPVSGLEVTSHMKERDRLGRVVDPFTLFRRKVTRAVKDMDEYVSGLPKKPTIRVVQADATRLSGVVTGPIAAAITSPPYHGAVDYYRRHQLEMFWLDFTRDQPARLALLDHYIGRLRVPNRDPLLRAAEEDGDEPWPLEKEMRAVNSSRANGFRHYRLSMHLSFRELAALLPARAPAVIVVGHSAWNGTALDTSELFSKLAGPWFRLEDSFSYEVRNRYMSYSRHNGANIDREYVLIFRRGRAQVDVSRRPSSRRR